MTVRLPGEFERHERTVICWPARTGLYGDRFSEAEVAHASVANVIVEFEPVTMLVDPAHRNRAEELCDPRVDRVTMPMDDAWFRDTGPIYILDDSVATLRVATDWAFNGWGNKFNPHDQDATLASRWSLHNRDVVRKMALVFEGGSINGNGDGVIATTEQCLLNPNRNPALGREQIENHLLGEFGANHMIWLPFGLALDDDTDGHVDNVVAFADAQTLVVQMCDDTSEDDYERMKMNRAAVDAFIRKYGISLKVVEVPVLPFAETPMGRVVVPYLNFYVGNGFVLVPVCGHVADGEMLEIIASAFPDRKTIGLNVGEILAVGGGGIHCITQQIPAV